MWKNVIKAKYEIDNLSWWSKMSSCSHGVGFGNLFYQVLTVSNI